MPQKGSDIVRKTLASAMANAQNNFELNPGNLVVSEIFAGEGPRLKRYKAGARGRYKPRVKRLSHLWVILAEREEE
jgi:large subunit ribosomal protein L22